MPNTYKSIALYNADGTGTEYGNNAVGSDIYAPFETSPTINPHFAGTYIRWKNDKVYRCKTNIDRGATLVDTGNNANVEIPTDIPDDVVTHTPEEGIYSVSGMVEAINAKQDASDTNLQTTAKTIVGGINEVNASLTVEDISSTLTIDRTLMPYGDVVAFKYGKLCYVSISSASFSSNLASQAIISGLPACRILSGTLANGEPSFSSSGKDNIWIDTNSTSIYAHIAYKDIAHYFYLFYLTIY